MATGARIRSLYQTGDTFGSVVTPITVTQATIDAEIDSVSNDPPAGPATNRGSATTSQGARSAGINARTVALKWTGTPPAGYVANSVVRIPVLRPATFASWVAQPGLTGTYRGAGVEVVGFSAETVR